MAVASRSLRAYRGVLDDYHAALDLPWERRAPLLDDYVARLDNLWSGMNEREREDAAAHAARNYRRRLDRLEKQYALERQWARPA